MYDELDRKCPKHPTLAHPCQICGSKEQEVPANSADNTLVQGIDWQVESALVYPNRPKGLGVFNPSERLMERLGPESGERRYGARERPGPIPKFPKSL